MLRFVSITCIAILLAALSGAAVAESLWPAENPKEMFVDKKARKVGDTITVVIVETSVSSSSASTDAKKSSSTSVDPGIGPLIKNIPGISYGGGDTMKSSGSTTRSSNFTATMTVTVTKVDENGNLEIEGSRSVQTNAEKEEIKLSGKVRPQDIGADNSILSSSIADAKITHTGKGPIGSRQREGIIGRILRILF